MDRRSFLKALSLGAVGLGTGAGTFVLRERDARAFGEAPPEAMDAMVPPEHRAQNILEVFLYGGVSQYESFYCVPEHGAADGTGWSLFLRSGDVRAALDACAVTGDLTEPFAPDANGATVHLGPFAMPLRARPDVLERTRIAITSHELMPHEGAIPLALGGRPLGSPSLAGLGAHVQRYFGERATSARAPFSYVLKPTSPGFPSDNIDAATAIGLHPGAARPLAVAVDSAGELERLLRREAVGRDRAAYDAAVQHYVGAYRARLARPGLAAPPRARRLTDLAAAASAMSDADAIAAVLASPALSSSQATECGVTATDTTAMSLRLATHLLTHPTAPARYVCVVDGGLVMADGGGGYDSHVENSRTQARNLGHTLRTLLALVNRPGENDPSKLDLDRTMIVLTTEFGRSPGAQDGGKGRNHWPYGYPITFIGGPVRNRGVFGACGPDSVATVASSPQENRIAALLALGIWPFSPESYGVSDVRGASDAVSAARLVTRGQLGLA